MNNFRQKNKGFTILFASLIGSLVMAIGMAILAVTIMQINLSSAGRESQHAFYAADTGRECALYLNYGGGNPNAGSTLCPDGVFPKLGGQSGVCANSDGSPFQYKCQNQQISFDPLKQDTDSVTTSFEISGVNPEDTCFKVDVIKYNDKTRIDSRGFSTCDSNNPNRFERAIKTDNF